MILTLAVVSLLTMLVITFFAISRSDMSSTRVYADGQAVKRLSDSAVQVVLAQIRAATRGFPIDPSGIPDLSKPLAWAAQPGMMHTFDKDGPARVYKLYSSDEMVDSGNGFDSSADQTAMDGWHEKLSLFTDLNSPVMVPDSGGSLVPVAPIVDLKNLVSLNGSMTYSSDGFTPDLEGFSVSPPDSYQAGAPVSPVNNPVPMPVRWIYLLEDGQMAVPTEDADGKAKFDRPGHAVPTKSNPVVSRIAFWTDDESAKVNINTASEGVYWDVPRTYSEEDVGKYTGSRELDQPGLAFGQPAQKEFQRYPGHPATTSLSAVLGKALPVPSSIDTSSSAYFEPYYELTPRINIGGSKSGTYIPASVLPIKERRLYVSADDFLFSPEFESNGLRRPNYPLTIDLVKTSKFFLSAHSSAPETTLFNTPRIAIWPVFSDPAKRTAYDKLAAFCSTVGDRPYYFTRQNPRSGTDDYTSRNMELYTWLQKLTSENIPGDGRSFAGKFGPGSTGVTDRDQLLTYIYDYIRCTNTQDRSSGATSYTRLDIGADYSGAVIPIQIGNTQGFGRFDSISEANIMFVGEGDEGTGDRAAQMRAVFVTGFVSPGHGMGLFNSKGLKYIVSGLDKMEIDFDSGEKINLGFQTDADGTNGVNEIRGVDKFSWHGRSVGGSVCPVMSTQSKQLRTSAGNQRDNYPFFSKDLIAIPEAPGKKTFNFSGGKIKVVIRTTDTDALVQTIHLNFPKGTFKIPGKEREFRQRMNGSGGFVQHRDTIVGLEPAGAVGNDPEPALDLTAGDVRLTVGLREVPENRFRAHNRYKLKGVQHAYALGAAAGSIYPGVEMGQMVPANNYRNPGINRTPYVSSRAETHVTHAGGGPGDWDTGFGDQRDGAHINKPNEGDSVYWDRQGNFYRPPYYLGHGQGRVSHGNVFFSPNLQVPSSMMFGSLPTGVQRGLPWQTLLFHPKPEDPTHPGHGSSNGPPDHLIADLFWMPVIEPYAISQPFVTAGKVNMNFQLQPFGYIHRDTAMRAVLKSTKFLALPLQDSTTYKPIDPAYKNIPWSPNRRRRIDLDLTLAEFDKRFNNDGVFKSATEICEMNLIPPGGSAASMINFWNANKLSGDNVREKPYVDIYPRVTTKTNTFTIHYKVQVLRKSRQSSPGSWDEEFDSVVAESRGSTIVERYIDPNDPRLPNFAKLPLTDPAANLDQYYRFRSISSSTFKP